MTGALVFSLPAAHRFHAGVELAEGWWNTLEFGGEGKPLFTVQHKNVAYVFRVDEEEIGPSIVIRIEPTKIFSCFEGDPAKLEALRRSVQAGLQVLDGSGQLPDYWRPFSGGKYITFQAQSIAKGDQRRLAMWRRLSGGPPCAYIFDVTSSQKDYDSLNPDFGLLQSILNERPTALASRPASGAHTLTVGTTTLDLGDLPEQVNTVVNGWKLGFLYQHRLTKQQRAFVDAPLDRPVRLKGAAGTGKSLAMVAKLLREAAAKKANGQEYRFLFVTHNASAAELALDYAIALDENDLLSEKDNQLIRIDTLLGLAIHDLAEDMADLQPISNDAHDGKKLQLLILSDIVDAYRHGAWITQRNGASEAIRLAFEAAADSPAREEFCWDLMNEIACVLDADGVRDNQSKREAYLKEKRRPRYLMSLDTISDRELILALYDQYRAVLRREGFISVDQLVADYLGYLDSFRWDARRQRLGYDAIFVDEYHLFNRNERAVFPSLMRTAQGALPVVLMALDPRQSPRAVFLEAAFGGDDHPIPLAAGQSKETRNFEFNDVFRYTPEIAGLLSYVNQNFPETDLSEEWLPGPAHSALPSGERPTAKELADQTTLYDIAVSTAEARQKQSGRGATAIITLSQKAFDVISKAGRYAKKLYVVDSRESLNRLQYAGSRIVFSMPEYVAGVQFEHVIVSDVNERDDVGRPTLLGRSRFGSNLYLAASRARRSVFLLADLKAGGFAPVIRNAIQERIVDHGPT